MKIYFAGSIRGGRDDKEIYSQIIEMLKSYGEVLTEHVGNPNLTEEGEDLPLEVVYERDMAWLRSADVIVADISTSSIGVGYEIASAEVLNKKILCLYRDGAEKKASGMILGNKNMTTKIYKNVEEIPTFLKNFFANL